MDIREYVITQCKGLPGLAGRLSQPKYLKNMEGIAAHGKINEPSDPEYSLSEGSIQMALANYLSNSRISNRHLIAQDIWADVYDIYDKDIMTYKCKDGSVYILIGDGDDASKIPNIIRNFTFVIYILRYEIGGQSPCDIAMSDVSTVLVTAYDRCGFIKIEI